MSLVSIIIPVYKVEKFIIKCLASVLSQSYQNIEVLLVDDCSPDASFDLVNQFLQTIPDENRVSWIRHDVNMGLSEARNSGMDAASGEYVYFLDSDDWISLNCIELLIKSATENTVDVAIGQTMCFLEKEHIEKLVFPLSNKQTVLEGNEEVFEAFMRGQWPVIAPNKLYRLDFLRENNLRFIPNLLAEDELWAFEWSRSAKAVSFVEEATYYYLLRENSIISTRKKKNFEDMFFILSRFNTAYLQERNSRNRGLLKAYIVRFKEMIIIMQWQAMNSDVTYLKHNYQRLKNYTRLNIFDYFSPVYPTIIKRKSLLFHMPTFIGYRYFIWRYER